MKKILTILLLTFGSFSSQGQPTITADGPLEFCAGESVTLCLDANFSSVTWNTEEMTQCITVSDSGTYFPVFVDLNMNIDSSLAQSPVEVIVHSPVPNVIHDNNGFLIVTNEFSEYQWSLNGVPIPNETNDTICPPYTGNYFVNVTDSIGCYGVSEIWEIVASGCTVGVEDLPQVLEQGFLIHPNPTSQIFRIHRISTVDDDSRLLVIDVKGRIAYQQILKQAQNDTPIDVSHLPNGIYLVSLTTENGQRHSERLVIQHE
jgi:hypothetical protein